MIYFKLFIVFAKIGLFSIGGGYAALPLIEESIINQNHWLDTNEFMNLLAISQMTPGPIAINAATFVGTNIAKTPGAIAATLGFVTPSAIIISIFSYIYFKYKDLGIIKKVLDGLKGAVIALIGMSGINMIFKLINKENTKNFDYKNIFLIIFSFIILRIFKKSDPVMIMIMIGIIGVLMSYFLKI